MPLRLKIKKELTARSDRVKSVDIFPSENPWVLTALYSGNIYIWDYSNNTMIKSFETGNNPVRCAKFIVRKQWIVAGTDDMKLRVFNYNTMDKVKEWEAHTDYIRFIEVHPNRPFILSSSDDMSVKMWDWERNFDCVQIFEGHSHYVMMARINPRDTNTFATASLDKTIKVWGLTAGTAHFSLEGHEKGVNCVDYYPGGDKPYLLSGADDRTVKIWDYQTKACLQTLEGHSHNVSSVCFHPRLPVIISSSEDGTVRLWHSTTYRPETTLNYGMDRVWAVACARDSNKVAIGYDEGTIVLKIGNEKPVASLDVHGAKLVWAQNHDIQTVSLKGLSKEGDLVDGERVVLNTRDLGACEVYPQYLAHNSNGSFVVICGDGEYIIYTSQALRNKAFGSALDFVWSSLGSGDYAIRESISRVKIFKNFKEHRTLSLPLASADGIFGGHCLAVKGPDCVVFFDWEEGVLLRKIDVLPLALYWSEQGDRVVIACADVFYVLRFDRDVVDSAVASGGVNSEEGVPGAFELLHTVNERVHTGQWVGECFLYTSGSRKLCYLVGGQSFTLCHLAVPSYLLGYVPKEDRVFLIDKTYNVVSHKLLLAVLSYQTAVVRRDFEAANSLLPLIPQSEHSAVARFLESQGFKEEALAVTADNEHKFELAIDLRKLEIAEKVLLLIDAQRQKEEGAAARESTDLQSKWRRLGDLALSQGNLPLAELCASQSADLSGLLLMYTSSGEKTKLVELIEHAKRNGRLNVAFVAALLSGKLEQALELLVEAKRVPEAAFFARTYLPSQVPRVLTLWQTDLRTINERAAEALASPVEYPNLFPDYDVALIIESMFLRERDRHIPASKYLQAKEQLSLDLIAAFKPQLEAMKLKEQERLRQEQELAAQTASLSIGDDLKQTAIVDDDPLAVDHETKPVETIVASVPSSPAKTSTPTAAPAEDAFVEAAQVNEDDDDDLLLDDVVPVVEPEQVAVSISPAVSPAKSAPVSPVPPVANGLEQDDLDAELLGDDIALPENEKDILEDDFEEDW